MAVFPRDFARFQSRSGIEASVCVLNPSKPLNLRRLTCDCPGLPPNQPGLFRCLSDVWRTEQLERAQHYHVLRYQVQASGHFITRKTLGMFNSAGTSLMSPMQAGIGRNFK